MKTYTRRLMGVFDEEAYFIRIPNEMIKDLDWKSGDVIEWIPNDDNSYSLRKL